MTVGDGYREAVDQNHNVLESKQCRGMNYPCPNRECILTFQSEDTMKKHLDEGSHIMQDEFVVTSTSDRVKKAWVAGLGGKGAMRKSG